MNCRRILSLLVTSFNRKYDIISSLLIDDTYRNMVWFCMGRIYNIHIHPNKTMDCIHCIIFSPHSLRHMTLCPPCSDFYLTPPMLIRTIIFTIVFSILSACTLPGTQSENTTEEGIIQYSGSGWSMNIPSTWNTQPDKSIPSPKN